MKTIEKLSTRNVPKMLDDMVVCVDSKVWNTVVNYINYQTKTINQLIDLITQVNNTSVQHSQSIQELANILKEHIEL